MKKVSSILIFIMAISILTGCWSRRELNDLAIISALSIDKIDNQYEITIQVINPTEVVGKQQTSSNPVTTFRETGPTLLEALRKMALEKPRKAYLPHLRIIVFGEEMARNGIQNSLDYLLRDHEVRADFLFTVAKNQKGSEILNVTSTIEKIPATKIFKSIDTSEKGLAQTKSVQLAELYTQIISKGSNPVLTGVYIRGNRKIGNDISNMEKISSPAKIDLDNLAIFKDDKLVDWFTSEESRGYNFITDNIKQTILTVPCKNNEGDITLDVIRSKTKMKTKVKGDKPFMEIITRTEGTIGEMTCSRDIYSEKTIEEMEKSLEKRLKELMEKTIEKAKKNQTDVFGLGEEIHRKHPKVWNKLKGNWHDKGFVELKVTIKPDVKIRRTGTTLQPSPYEQK